MRGRRCRRPTAALVVVVAAPRPNPSLPRRPAETCPPGSRRPRPRARAAATQTGRLAVVVVVVGATPMARRRGDRCPRCCRCRCCCCSRPARPKARGSCWSSGCAASLRYWFNPPTLFFNWRAGASTGRRTCCWPASFVRCLRARQTAAIPSASHLTPRPGEDAPHARIMRCVIGEGGRLACSFESEEETRREENRGDRASWSWMRLRVFAANRGPAAVLLLVC